MIDDRVVQYVALGLNQGYSEEKIRSKLKKSGYSEEVIDEAFSYHKEAKEDASEEYYNDFLNFLKVYHKQVLITVLVIIIGVWAVWTLASNISNIRVIAEDFTQLVGQKIPEQKCLDSPEPDICLLKEAKASDTTWFCGKIKDRTVRRACKERFWERRDCFYERLVDEGTDQCYLEFARQTGDLKICDYVKDPDLKAGCG